MRLLLLLTLIHGLVPGVGEVVESVVHYAAEGHLAHSDADQGDLGDQGDEHGCGTTEHLCSCCSSQILDAPSTGDVLPATPVASHRLPAGVRVASLDAPAPPLRPPISS